MISLRYMSLWCLLPFICLLDLGSMESEKSNEIQKSFSPRASLNHPKIPFLDIVANSGAFWLLKPTTSKPLGQGTEILAGAKPGSLIPVYSCSLLRAVTPSVILRSANDISDHRTRLQPAPNVYSLLPMVHYNSSAAEAEISTINHSNHFS